MQALILAGGQGLRLRPLTADRPKPMVPLNGKPIAEWQVDWVRANANLEKVTFLCGYKWERLKEHFGTKYKGADVAYSVEEEPLGTGGAIKKGVIDGRVSGEVVIMNGDVVTAMKLREMVRFSKSAAIRPTATILLVPYKSRFGLIKFDTQNVVTSFDEKPDLPDAWINGGIYLADAERLAKYLPDKGDIERATFPKLAETREALAYPYTGFWTAVDSMKDLQEAEKELNSIAAGSKSGRTG
jgi:mannose-1-phosphate guanylyltransferase